MTRVIALGNESAGDDGAAIRAARSLEDELAVIVAGRPGAGLLDLLEGDVPTVLVDVTRSRAAAGSVIRIPLTEITEASISSPQVSSHGFGPGAALRLGQALGRSLPPGCFVGIEGAQFEVGGDLSEPVRAAMGTFVDAIRRAAHDLAGA